MIPKVGQYVRPFNEDGRTFIRRAADLVYAASTNGEHAVSGPNRKEQRSRHPNSKTAGNSTSIPQSKCIPIPSTISHFVMNLPASAISFLPCFRGLYFGKEQLFAPHTGTKLPMVHVHCFAPKADDDTPFANISERISAEIGIEMRSGDAENAYEVSILEVRNVAPNKRMFCASFRVPPEVAFADRP